MKKLILATILSLVFTVFVPKAFAFDSLPHSFKCSSVDNTLITFNSSNVFEGFFSCSGTPFSLAIHGADTYSIIECDPSLSDCDTTDYTTLISSDGYVTTTLYTWTEIPQGSCASADSVCYHDWLIMNMFIIFFLSTISMGLFINFKRSK